VKKLVIAVSVIIILVALITVGCTNKGLLGPTPGATDESVVDSCVTCHTDKTILKELAVTEEEDASGETTGEG
jgi:hypothetical protein